ncbi:MAG: DUF4167 domain-containing protein [Pseudomonadota bacterium]
MRQTSKSSRPRNKGNRKSNGASINRVYESSGPEGKVRGTPQQIIEKYQTLARDRATAGDRILAESFLQHAEHYARILTAAQAASAAQQPRRDDDYEDDQDSGGGRDQREQREPREPREPREQREKGSMSVIDEPKPDAQPQPLFAEQNTAQAGEDASGDGSGADGSTRSSRSRSRSRGRSRSKTDENGENDAQAKTPSAPSGFEVVDTDAQPSAPISDDEPAWTESDVVRQSADATVN